MARMYPLCIELKVIILIYVLCMYEVNPSSGFLLICERDDSGSSSNGRVLESINNTCYADGNYERVCMFVYTHFSMYTN